MKLKKFEQFINEAKSQVADVEANIEETVFLIKGTVYSIYEIVMGGSVAHEESDRSVGVMSDYSYVDNWWPVSIDGVETFKDPSLNATLIEEINSIEGSAIELSQIGLGTPTKAQQLTQKESLVWDTLNNNELVEVTDRSALTEILESIKNGSAIDLTGKFEDKVESEFKSKMKDYGRYNGYDG